MTRLKDLRPIRDPGNAPAPPDLLERLRQAYRSGEGEDPRRYACRSSALDGASKDVRKRLDGIAGGHDGLLHAVHAAFLYAMLDRGATLRLGFMRCAAQQELSLAAYHLPVEPLRTLREAVSVLPIDRQEWTRSYVGAVAFARVAHALKDAGELYMPSPVEDVVEKIDLVLELPSVVLCLTMKSDVRSGETTHAILDAEGLDAGMETWAFRFARGVEDFAARQGGPCVPVFLRVGTANEPLWVDPRECRSVARGVQALLARFVETQEPTP